MQNVMNRRWLLATYPEGMPTLDSWIIDKQPVPDPGAGQILVKAKWLSVDPYMRGRISPATNYTKGTAIGEAMQGGGQGKQGSTDVEGAYLEGDVRITFTPNLTPNNDQRMTAERVYYDFTTDQAVLTDAVMRQVDDHIVPAAPAQLVCVIRKRLSDAFDVIQQTYLTAHELRDPNRHRI